MIVDHHLLQRIFAALNAPGRLGTPQFGRSILRQIGADGWMYRHQLEDLAYAFDPRIEHPIYGFDLAALVEPLRYRWQSFYTRPRMRSIETVGGDGLRAADAASFLLDLEKLGFAFDPSVLVDTLRPSIAKQRFVSSSELDIFWSAKVRGKSEIVLEVDDQELGYSRIETGKFANGYRYEAWLAKDGSIRALGIKSPRFRARPKPFETECVHCGFKWWRGDPDSSAQHRQEHKERMIVLEPASHPMLLEARQVEEVPDLVDVRSAPWKHAEIYRRASAFRREMGFDFVQWDSPDGDADPNVQGFLLSDADARIHGAVAFRLREAEKRSQPSFWGLQWAWVRPGARRTGFLSHHWPMFRERFGDFYVEGPVSEGMQAFLRARGDEHLMDWPSRRTQPERT